MSAVGEYRPGCGAVIREDVPWGPCRCGDGGERCSDCSGPMIVAGTKYVIDTTAGRKLIVVVVAGERRVMIRRLRAKGKCWTATEWVSVEGLRVLGLRCPDARMDRDLMRLAAKVPS